VANALIDFISAAAAAAASSASASAVLFIDWNLRLVATFRFGVVCELAALKEAIKQKKQHTNV
jgi:hypothetical protein